jgi:hypothetical protein
MQNTKEGTVSKEKGMQTKGLTAVTALWAQSRHDSERHDTQFD